MRNPPAVGIHARHRTLDTPGPTGWNDHGDPTHRRRQGNTPGSLGDDDHGTPLAGRLPLLGNQHDAEIEKIIDETIARANAAGAARDLAAKLQACLAAVGQAHQGDRVQDPKLHAVEGYFEARLRTVEGKANIAPDEHPEAPQLEQWLLGSVEYRVPGEYFKPVTGPAGNVPLEAASLSYRRIGQQPPAPPVAADSSSYWSEKGRTDGLRDRAAGGAELRLYSTMNTFDR